MGIVWSVDRGRAGTIFSSCRDVAVQYVAEPDPAIHHFNCKFTNSEDLLAKMANKFSFEF